jgi:hypothetical protein
MPKRGAIGFGSGTDLSALVNANLALANQNLSMSGAARKDSENGFIRLFQNGGQGGGGTPSSTGGSPLIMPSSVDFQEGLAGMSGEIPVIHGKRDRGPSSAFFGTSFGVAGSYGSMFPPDMGLTSTPDGADLNSFYGEFAMSPNERGRQSTGSEFPVGSLGTIADLNDALPAVGSLELGSPLDLDAMMSSLPKSNGKGPSLSSILGKPKKQEEVSPLGRASTRHTRGQSAVDAMSALKK